MLKVGSRVRIRDIRQLSGNGNGRFDDILQDTFIIERLTEEGGAYIDWLDSEGDTQLYALCDNLEVVDAR